MKRILLLVLAVALFLTAIPASALAEGYLEATGARVNVRSGPGNEYTDLYTLIRGETVDYLGVYARDSYGVVWYKVQYYSYGPGWVSSEYSRITGSGSASSGGSSNSGNSYGSYVRASGGDVNIRSYPNLTASSLGVMHNGNTASYLGRQSTDDRGVVWYYVNFSGTVGWVSSRYSKLVGGSSYVPSAPSAPSAPSLPSFGSYVVADDGNVNIRSTPSLNGRDLDTMHRGETASYLGRQSTDDRGVVWYYVNFNGTIGWASSRYSSLR